MICHGIRIGIKNYIYNEFQPSTSHHLSVHLHISHQSCVFSAIPSLLVDWPSFIAPLQRQWDQARKRTVLLSLHLLRFKDALSTPSYSSSTSKSSVQRRYLNTCPKIISSTIQTPSADVTTRLISLVQFSTLPI